MIKVCNYCGNKRRRYIWGLCFDCYDDFKKETGIQPIYRKPSYFDKRKQTMVLNEIREIDEKVKSIVFDEFNNEIAYIGYSTKY